MEKVNIHSLNGFNWIDCYDIDFEESPELIAKYNLSLPLVKDALQPGHLPKFEIYDHGQFFILRAYTAQEEDLVNNINQLSDKIAFFVNDNQLVTFHKFSFPFLKLKNTQYNSPFELMFYLIRSVFKTYTEPVTWHSNEIDRTEELLFTENLSRISLEDLYYQKLEIRLTKKLLNFSQNVLNLLKTPDSVKSEHQDVKEVLVQLILEYEEALDDANSLANTFLSVNTKKSNDVMKLLTIFSAFFLPLTFIVGIYGMNFVNMPELQTRYGYFAVLIVMAVMSVIIWMWFKKKKIL